MKKLFVIAVFLFLQSCNPENTTPRVEVQMDEFSREIKITNNIEESLFVDEYYDRNPIYWFLSSSVNRDTGKTNYQVIVTTGYHAIARHNFSKASDDEATVLKVEKIMNAGKPCLQRCKLIEQFSVTLNEAALKRHSMTGYRIKIVGKTMKEIIIKISPQYIQTQLATVAKYSQAKN